MSDPINSPEHYQIKFPYEDDGEEINFITYEVKDLIEERLIKLSETLDGVPPQCYFYYANVIKYIMRWFAKGEGEDLKKARKYIDFLLEEYE